MDTMIEIIIMIFILQERLQKTEKERQLLFGVVTEQRQEISRLQKILDNKLIAKMPTT